MYIFILKERKSEIFIIIIVFNVHNLNCLKYNYKENIINYYLYVSKV